MSIPLRSTLMTIMFIAVLSGWALADCVPFGAIEASVKKEWAARYPGEKVLKAEKAGPSSMYEKAVATGKKARSAGGVEYEVMVKARFCLQPLKVTVMQGSKKTVFAMGWHYRQTPAGFVYDHFSVGESSTEAGKGKEPPSNDDVREMIKNQYKKQVSTIKEINTVTIRYLKYREHSSSGRWWYEFEADITGTDNEGAPCKAKENSGSVFRGVMNEQGKDMNAPWNIDLAPNGCY
ncbi:MAG: hypothetical protein KA369_21225 [Spirochaetes bacterium]|nr:hypothetical protein [Spirochaetota bacterium]